MQFGGFHGHEIWQISWNLVDFMKSGGFHGKDLYICIGSDKRYSILVVDEIWQISCMKSGGFHEIQQISWNSADFMKFGGFHEIQQISPWNPVDFMPRTLVLMKNTAFSGRPCNTVYLYWFWRKIHYSWNLADFMVKSGRFHEIRWISWNPVDFIHEIRRISWLILKNANLKM